MEPFEQMLKVTEAPGDDTRSTLSIGELRKCRLNALICADEQKDDVKRGFYDNFARACTELIRGIG